MPVATKTPPTSDLPIAPRLACRVETREQFERNRDRYRKLHAEGAQGLWIEVYCEDDDGTRAHRHYLHMLEAEARYGSPTWTQAHITDDGAARVLRRGSWRPWRPTTARRPGRAARPATNVRRRGSRRSSARSSSRGDPDDESEAGLAARRPCDCGGFIEKPARGPWPNVCAECKLEREAGRKRAERALVVAHARFAAMPQENRLVVWRALGGETLLAAVAGFKDPAELFPEHPVPGEVG